MNELIPETDLQQLIGILVKAYEAELSKLSYDTDRFKVVFDKMYEYYITTNLFSFYTLVNIKSIVDDTLSNVIFRDFFFNYVEHAMLDVKAKDLDLDGIINSIVDSVCATKVDPDRDNTSLLIKEMNQSLYVNASILKVLLKDNVWLMFLYILITKYYETEAYKSSI